MCLVFWCSLHSGVPTWQLVQPWLSATRSANAMTQVPHCYFSGGSMAPAGTEQENHAQVWRNQALPACTLGKKFIFSNWPSTQYTLCQKLKKNVPKFSNHTAALVLHSSVSNPFWPAAVEIVCQYKFHHQKNTPKCNHLYLLSIFWKPGQTWLFGSLIFAFLLQGCVSKPISSLSTSSASFWWESVAHWRAVRLGSNGQGPRTTTKTFYSWLMYIGVLSSCWRIRTIMGHFI